MGTEEDSSERDSDEESGDPSVAVGDHRKNVWNITKEQLNYYTTQFFSMQTNPEGVIPGNQVSVASFLLFFYTLTTFRVSLRSPKMMKIKFLMN